VKISTFGATEVHAQSIYLSAKEVKRLAPLFAEAAAKNEKVSLEVE
jgi:hypothetical protein